MAVSRGIDATYDKSKGEVVANKGAQPGEKPKRQEGVHMHPLLLLQLPLDKMENYNYCTH